ncbi:MAG: hypothetical protein GVY12_11785, partial [Bacteroidetes bacterium]|nr:hypothetical protein [Bacteroidota bacterium]
LDEERHFYYTTNWQVIEERVKDGVDLDPNVQYVWGGRYVDDLVMRLRDTDADGDIEPDNGDETVYAVHDVMFNITALTDSGGDVLERYTYTPYGERTVLDPNWSEDADGTDYAFVHGHQGLRHDRETGLIENRYRMRHVTLARWLQRDPIGYADGMNAYGAYHVIQGELDPSGLEGGLHPLFQRKATKKCRDETKYTECVAEAYNDHKDRLAKIREAASILLDQAFQMMRDDLTDCEDAYPDQPIKTQMCREYVKAQYYYILNGIRLARFELEMESTGRLLFAMKVCDDESSTWVDACDPCPDGTTPTGDTGTRIDY